MKKKIFPSKILPALLISTTLLFPSLSYATKDNEIRIHGSDLFSTWLPDYFNANAGYLNIDFNLTGSYSGMMALTKKHADASICIKTTSNNELPDGFESVQIGHYVLYLHAHKDFPSPEISKEAIARVAQVTNPMSVEYWKQIFDDANDEWESKKAEILIDQAQNKFALSFFRLAFLDSQKPSGRVILCRDQKSIANNMNRNRGCILVSPNKQSKIENVEPLQLSDFNDPTSFPPTRENIQYSDYSATFPILLIIPKNASYKKSLLDVFQNKHFSQTMEKHHLLPSL